MLLSYKDEIKKQKEKRLFSFFIKNFFNLFSFKEGANSIITDEKETFLNFFDIEDVTAEEKFDNSTVLIESFKQQLKSKFDAVSYMKLFSDSNSLSIESFTVFPFPKIILLSFLSRKHTEFFKKFVNDNKNFNNPTFENLYNIYFFRNNQKIIENHLLECACNEKINYSDSQDIVAILSSKKYYKYISIFKDLYTNCNNSSINSGFVSGANTFFFELIYNNSLVLSSKDDFYGIFALYFLVDIFGIIPSMKGVCVYSLLYKLLLDCYRNTSYYFIQTSLNLTTSSLSIRKIKELKLEEKLLFINFFEKENKEDAIKEILFDNDTKDFTDYLSSFYIFGAIYSPCKNKKNMLQEFYKKQRDYIEKIEGDKITFFNFETGFRTEISFENDLTIDEENLTVSFYDKNIQDKIILSKYSVNKLKNTVEIPSENNIKLKTVIEEEVKLFYCLNMINDNLEAKILFKKILSGKKRDENVYTNFTEEEYKIIERVVCFSKFEDNDFYLKNNKSFKDLIISKEEEETQEICKYFLNKK